MAQRWLLRACVVLIFFYPNFIFAATAWLAGEDEYSLGLSASYTTSFDRDVYFEAEKSNNLEQQITFYELKIREIKEKWDLPAYVINQRVKAYNEKIEGLKVRQNLLQKDFLKASQHLYVEKGINQKYSFGLSVNHGYSIGFVKRSSEFVDGELFLKRKLFENKKWMISGEIGVKAEDYRNGTLNVLSRVNGAYVKKYKNGRKQITEMNIGSLMTSSHSNICSEIRESLELVSGYIIQLSSYYKYDQRLNPGYRYFFRDQVVVAKKIKGDIFPFSEKAIISLGLYQDHFHKNRKRAGKGIYGGLWIRL